MSFEKFMKGIYESLNNESELDNTAEKTKAFIMHVQKTIDELNPDIITNKISNDKLMVLDYFTRSELLPYLAMQSPITNPNVMIYSLILGYIIKDEEIRFNLEKSINL